MDLLIKYLEKELPNIDIQPFLDAFSEKKKIKKGEILIAPGDNALHLNFINKGSFRVYFINKNGQEITTWFAFQNMWVTDLRSYYKNTRANFYVQALEESEIYTIQKTALENLYSKYPKYLTFAKNFAEQGMIIMLQRSDHLFQELSAEERYIELLKTPILKHNVPLKYIATFLGITETSLSRIRRKIAKG